MNHRLVLALRLLAFLFVGTAISTNVPALQIAARIAVAIVVIWWLLDVAWGLILVAAGLCAFMLAGGLGIIAYILDCFTFSNISPTFTALPEPSEYHPYTNHNRTK